jgi:hypothetical protein
VDLCVRSLMDQALCLMEEVSGRAGVTNRAADCCGVEGRAEGHG